MSRIVQILESLHYGDAISNHAIAIHRALLERGQDSILFAKNIDPRVQKNAQFYNTYSEQPEDVILYHLSIGSDMNREIVKHRCKKVINYHNVTPWEFFAPYNVYMAQLCRKGREDAAFLADKVDMAISDSAYNTSELAALGFRCPLHSIPIIMNYSDYENAPDPKVMTEFSKNITNIVFIGRIAPNKKQEDVIKDFYYYTKYFNPNSRLILVGNYNNFESYYLKLKAYVRKLGLKNVIFTGHVQFSEMLAYYRTADVLLCESAHEGFCVPMVEGMYFGVPVVAYDSSAVGETLADGGILLPEKNAALAAAVIDQVVRDNALREEIHARQKQRLEAFAPEKLLDRFLQLLITKKTA